MTLEPSRADNLESIMQWGMESGRSQQGDLGRETMEMPRGKIEDTLRKPSFPSRWTSRGKEPYEQSLQTFKGS